MAGGSVVAKAKVRELVKTVDFSDAIDLGGDDKVHILEGFALVRIDLVIFQKMGRGIAFKLMRRDRTGPGPSLAGGALLNGALLRIHDIHLHRRTYAHHHARGLRLRNHLPDAAHALLQLEDPLLRHVILAASALKRTKMLHLVEAHLGLEEVDEHLACLIRGEVPLQEGQ